jgi:hypothetical protein
VAHAAADGDDFAFGDAAAGVIDGELVRDAFLA